MRVEVKSGACTGHGLCAAVAPDVYVLDDDGYNETPPTEVAAALEDQARSGAEACPEQAILVRA